MKSERLIALFLLFSTLPLQLLIWLAVRLTSRGPGFYASIRLGQFRKLIRVWKFRSMNAGIALEIMAGILENEEWKTFRKLRRDPRITPVGKWLRRFSLDELPQLWNVLNGTMSLIGPRPIVRAEEKLYGKYSVLIHSLKPGITGLWQVSGRSNIVDFEEVVALDAKYITEWSLREDLKILWKTVLIVIKGKGAV